MKKNNIVNLLILIIFIIYISAIFYMNWMILFLVTFFNIIIMYLLKINIFLSIKNIFQVFPFILFVILINLISMNITSSLIIGFKLILVCNSTYIYSKTTSINKFAKTVSSLFKFFKFINIDNKDIELLLSISITMLPSIQSEMKQLIEACKEKDISFSAKNSKYIFSKLLTSILVKTESITYALKEKGY